VRAPASTEVLADAAHIEALDTAGAWCCKSCLLRLRDEGLTVTLQGLRPEFARLLDVVAQQVAEQANHPAAAASAAPTALARIGCGVEAALGQAMAMLGFIGENAAAFAGCVAHPARFRWRPILFNIRSAGFDALPIVGLLSFLLGVVVAYQGADQLRQYGANIFVVDLVGLSMLREFAP